jgi:hypothetical protein
MRLRDYLFTRWGRRLVTPSPWAAAVAVLGGLAAWQYGLSERQAPDGTTGGSTLRLWYGVLGTLLTVFISFVFVVHRRRLARGYRRPAGRRRDRPPLPRAVWLRAHVWLGVLGLVLVLGHCGWPGHARRVGPNLAGALLLVFLLTTFTGFAGILLQAVAPRGLTDVGRRTAAGVTIAEVPSAQVPDVCAAWRREAAGLVRYLEDVLPAAGRPPALEAALKPLLMETAPRGRKPWKEAEAALAELRARAGGEPFVEKAVLRLATILTDRRELHAQQRWYAGMALWLSLHASLAVAVLVLVTLHAAVSLSF